MSIMCRYPWVPDSVSPKCIRCTRPFTFFHRRHHCRQCGLLLCAICSPRRHRAHGYRSKVRVCQVCYDFLNAEMDEKPLKPPCPCNKYQADLDTLPQPSLPADKDSLPPLQILSLQRQLSLSANRELSRQLSFIVEHPSPSSHAQEMNQLHNKEPPE